MRLADFITQNMEPILTEWVDFAKSCGPAARSMDIVALRDHAAAMLTDIASDLRTSQTPAEQQAKSRGDNAPDGSVPDTAAEVHGAGRAQSGFTMAEMVSEYRALRASVIRLWSKDSGILTGADLQDLMRFNESIDQALAESVTRYADDVDRSKEIFVAILGHDLRNPLNAVLMASQFMLDTEVLGEPHATMTTRIVSSARRMIRMTNDLLEFARGHLGGGIPVVRVPMDLADEVANAAGEFAVVYPQRVLQMETTGSLSGSWDSARITQVLANLLGNAAQHGASDKPVSLTASGEGDCVVIRVHNWGTPIPPGEMHNLFSPFKRLNHSVPASNGDSNLGLGLFIVERIVSAHGGSIAVASSDEEGTEFAVSLPR